MSSIFDLFSLDGKIALVTGASSGIGRAMAAAMAAAGASVVHAARREEPLGEAVEDIRKQGGKAAYVVADVGDREALSGLAAQATLCFGTPDILVNAAGINLREPWDEITGESWNLTLALNLTAPFFLGRLLVPAMQERGWGRIINIASLQSMRAFPNSMAYGASKGGVMQLTRAMAEAWSKNRSGITCNGVAPGFFRTGLTEKLYDDKTVVDALAAQTIIGRTGEMADLDGLTLFLGSRASDYITGQTIFLDGGWTAK